VRTRQASLPRWDPGILSTIEHHIKVGMYFLSGHQSLLKVARGPLLQRQDSASLGPLYIVTLASNFLVNLIGKSGPKRFCQVSSCIFCT
jgi:hypothetical protein